LQAPGFVVDRQVLLPSIFDGTTIDAGYRLDLMIEKSVIVELMAVDALTAVQKAQIPTYLKLSGCWLF